MPKLPQILQKNIVAKSRLFHIEAVHLRFQNGVERTFERLVSRKLGAVLVVPLLDAETLLLVREYAVGVERYELGFPKGIVEADEEILVAANREMMEEIGYGAHQLTCLGSLTTSPGYWGSSAAIVLAEGLYSASLPGDEPEPLEVVPWPLKNYRALLQQENFTEARSVAALMLLKEHLEERAKVSP